MRPFPKNCWIYHTLKSILNCTHIKEFGNIFQNLNTLQHVGKTIQKLVSFQKCSSVQNCWSKCVHLVLNFIRKYAVILGVSLFVISYIPICMGTLTTKFSNTSASWSTRNRYWLEWMAIKPKIVHVWIWYFAQYIFDMYWIQKWIANIYVWIFKLGFGANYAPESV